MREVSVVALMESEQQMIWPCLKLLSPIEEAQVHGLLVEQAPAEKCSEATQRAYEIDGGVLILTEWNGLLHEVIYQTPLEDEVARRNRMTRLFDFYGDGYTWNEVVDNGWGKSFERSDGERFAMWSYYMDYQTFMTMEFHNKWSRKQG